MVHGPDLNVWSLMMLMTRLQGIPTTQPITTLSWGVLGNDETGTWPAWSSGCLGLLPENAGTVIFHCPDAGLKDDSDWQM